MCNGIASAIPFHYFLALSRLSYTCTRAPTTLPFLSGLNLIPIPQRNAKCCRLEIILKSPKKVSSVLLLLQNATSLPPGGPLPAPSPSEILPLRRIHRHWSELGHTRFAQDLTSGRRRSTQTQQNPKGKTVRHRSEHSESIDGQWD